MPTSDQLRERLNAAVNKGQSKAAHRRAAEALLVIFGEAYAAYPDIAAEALHQAAVSEANAGQYTLAMQHFDDARKVARSDVLAGAIDRDASGVALKKRDFDWALKLIDQALEAHESDQRQRMVDIGFKGRIHSAYGWHLRWDFDALSRSYWRPKVTRGVQAMQEVDKYFAPQADDDSARLCLYNKLHLATALARLGDKAAAHRTAAEALALTRRPAAAGGTIGNYQHKLRAQAIRRAGWKGELAVRAVTGAGRKVLNAPANLHRIP